MKYKDLIYRAKDRIATVTLNRPDRMNALTPNLEAELHRAFDEADADPQVKVVVLTGAGAAFCAGFDQQGTPGQQRRLEVFRKNYLLWTVVKEKWVVLHALIIAVANTKIRIPPKNAPDG